MNFHQPEAQIFVPDGLPVEAALSRTTHMAISAHQDDIEIMAAGPIVQCFQREDMWFTGVVVTDGRGSPRDEIYKDYSDEQMRVVRQKEQKKAAIVGEYAAQVLLDFPSREVKDSANWAPVEDLEEILKVAKPQYVFTHNLADKHDTHAGVALKVITALRRLPESEKPQAVYGCEVWRNLDWMVDSDKVGFDLTAHQNLQAALLGVFDSQIAGGKRYDLATMGRRRSNATYFESHGTDVTEGLSFAMDLTPLIYDVNLNINEYVQAFIERFAQDVANRITRFEPRKERNAS
jgi:LmbE family N-acetylglucosaminyl deacetylase